MLIATKGIVFKSIKFQESSLIVKIYTETHGLQTFMVKGIRSIKANGKAAMFQPGMLLDIIMYYQEHKSFKSLREYRASHVYTTVMDDIRKSSVLMFLIEMLDQCIHADTEDEKLFVFINNSLREFDERPFEANFHIQFLLEFMKHLGIFPNGQRTSLLSNFNIREGQFTSFSAANSFILADDESILFNNVLQNEAFELDRVSRKKVLKIVLDYYSYHLENFKGIKSLKVLETILS
ncbi:MAG: DNA repair protein RecO (recombination protein O) [Chitinophagales bacterium]|jgi:DNA repair protein RecO (recombination protein O)